MFTVFQHNPLQNNHIQTQICSVTKEHKPTEIIQKELNKAGGTMSPKYNHTQTPIKHF
jgi:hypothetical protein